MGVLEREALAQREERDDDAAEPEGTDEELEQPRAEASGLVDGHLCARSLVLQHTWRTRKVGPEKL